MWLFKQVRKYNKRITNTAVTFFHALCFITQRMNTVAKVVCVIVISVFEVDIYGLAFKGKCSDIHTHNPPLAIPSSMYHWTQILLLPVLGGSDNYFNNKISRNAVMLKTVIGVFCEMRAFPLVFEKHRLVDVKETVNLEEHRDCSLKLIPGTYFSLLLGKNTGYLIYAMNFSYNYCVKYHMEFDILICTTVWIYFEYISPIQCINKKPYTMLRIFTHLTFAKNINIHVFNCAHQLAFVELCVPLWTYVHSKHRCTCH